MPPLRGKPRTWRARPAIRSWSRRQQTQRMATLMAPERIVEHTKRDGPQEDGHAQIVARRCSSCDWTRHYQGARPFLTPAISLESPRPRVTALLEVASTYAHTMLLAAALAALPADAALGRMWSVRPDGSGDAPTIQAAIDSAATGDSVIVAPGTYHENLRIVGKTLYLAGALRAEVTTVDGGQRTNVVRMRDGTVERLTLRNGLSTQGGGVYIAERSSAIVRHCIIEHNVAGPYVDSGLGGGVYCGYSPQTLIEENIIRHNSAGNSGGGITGDAVIRNNLVYLNAAHNTGGGIQGGGVVGGNIIVDNYADNQAAGVCGGGDFRNNTIAGNVVGQPGVAVNALGPSHLVGNIFVWNTSVFANGRANVLACDGCTLECNNFWENDNDAVLGTGITRIDDFALDPQFCGVDPLASLNFALQQDSPCAPGHHPSGAACGLIGAAPIGCNTVAISRLTWGGVKSLYR